VVTGAVGDIVTVHGLLAAPGALLSFSGGASALVTEVLRDSVRGFS
jgi:hypothetical protein